ncbi:imm11 family protein [Corallococcus macrosporus]|uniref:Immunity MXAN-0049 protein domain-containing protein n=1 Tax=Myxococcus fulvus (strain ATCC BAA-855 / HW-1) TaxID=483219 RepID=F8CNN6_MYXFH|nr:DUF1629 domain-containing protein [Corallococcus macrosporus]AEI64053.1 hypothetical protein LILAB_10710 [Corallococcus macrosporus]
MNYFLIETLGDTNDSSLCLIDSEPEGMGLESYYLSVGKKAAPFFPENARLQMSDAYPGIVAGSLIGNIKRFLLVDAKTREIFARLCPGVEIEYLPFTLYNHKGRIHSRDYGFVNPVGAVDCLDFTESQIEYLGRDIVRIEERVLDPRKLRHAPDLFRIERDAQRYVISERMVDALEASDPTNILVTELAQSGQR